MGVNKKMEFKKVTQEEPKTTKNPFQSMVGSGIATLGISVEVKKEVSQMIEPVFDKTEKYKKSVDHCINNVGILQRRLEEVEFLMSKVQRQSNTYDTISENIDKFNSKMRKDCEDAKNQVFRLNNKIEVIEQNIDRNSIQ